MRSCAVIRHKGEKRRLIPNQRAPQGPTLARCVWKNFKPGLFRPVGKFLPDPLDCRTHRSFRHSRDLRDFRSAVTFTEIQDGDPQNPNRWRQQNPFQRLDIEILVTVWVQEEKPASAMGRTPALSFVTECDRIGFCANRN